MALVGTAHFSGDLVLKRDAIALCWSWRESRIVLAIQPIATAMTKASPPAAVIIGDRPDDKAGRRVGRRCIDRGSGRQIGGGVGAVSLSSRPVPRARPIWQALPPYHCRFGDLAALSQLLQLLARQWSSRFAILGVVPLIAHGRTRRTLQRAELFGLTPIVPPHELTCNEEDSSPSNLRRSKSRCSVTPSGAAL